MTQSFMVGCNVSGLYTVSMHACSLIVSCSVNTHKAVWLNYLQQVKVFFRVSLIAL